MAEAEEDQIDEGLYSRQLYVLGHDAMRAMKNSTVLVSGFDGLAIELVKNIILAGVKSVTIVDNQPITNADCGSNFYLSPGEKAPSRAEFALPKLKELNRYVNVDAITGVVSEELLTKHSVFVTIGAPISEQLRLNALCRQHGVKFIAASIHGVFGSVFVDLGTQFVINDVNGEQPKEGIISMIQKNENSNKTLITVHEDSRHGMETGSMVKFEEIEGMVSLNNQSDDNPTLHRITEKSPYTFEIDMDTSKLSDYVPGTGRFIQVKQPTTVDYKTLEASLQNPDILPFDFGKFDRMMLHHAFNQGLSQFRDKNGRFPSPTSKEDAAAVADLCAALLEDASPEQKKTLMRLARCSSAVINPMAALFGGIVGQEVLKACSGKFTPIKQFLYFDAEEVIPDDDLENLGNFAVSDSRYDGMVAVFGSELQKKLKEMNVFIIGSGAIGCEMLKNWSMMGVACDGGLVHVTDMDVIEKSNLNRQFLFRNHDIGKLKSETAAKAAQDMNKDFNITAASNRVGRDSENVYNEQFWQSQDLIITALDNVDARMYVDAKCVEFKKPMVDSGTVGTKGSTQVVVPYLTESYASQADPPPEEFPICLLKNFPNKIEHTIQWARDDFEGIFKQTPEDVNKFLTDPDFFQKLAEDPVSEVLVLKNITKALGENWARTWDECVRWAIMKFTEHFSHMIQQLLYNFPADSLTKEGAKFWSGPKRAPTPIEFDVKDPVHLEYVLAAAALCAESYGIEVNKNKDDLIAIASSIQIPKFSPKKIKIASTSEEAKELAKEIDTDEVQTLRNNLPQRETFGDFKMAPLEFEKDDPTNFHVAYTTACANLRARNYGIKEVSKHEAKRLAGRIIPAIATTTAMVTGFVCLEIMKIIQNKPVEAFRNAFCNMAVPLFTLSEPMPPAKTKSMLKGKEWNWSLWDNLEIDIGNVTLQEFLDHFEEELQLEINMVTFGPAMIYAFFTPQKKLKVRKKMTMTQLILEVAKVEVPKNINRIQLDVSCVDPETDEDVDLPTCILNLGSR